MKKILTMAAVAMLALASCSQTEELGAGGGKADGGAEAQAPYVGFSTYSARSTNTRAGYVGSITDTELKDLDGDGNHAPRTNGFGVFAYHTGTKDYGEHTTKYPNFMYNEHITWNKDNAAWEYAPLKPWPNGNATADNQGATADQTDGEAYGSKVSFFAYAPYVDESTDFTAETSGIVGMSANSATTDPTITYRLADNSKAVDLLWGTVPTTASYETVTGTTQGGTYYDPDKNTGAYSAATVGTTFNGDESLYPVNINLVKQQLDQKVEFLFKHALAKIGGSLLDGETEDGTASHGLQVQLDIDDIRGGTKADYQIVTIRDIQIACKKELADASESDPTKRYKALVNKGTLNLATGRWSDTETVGTAPSTKQVIASPASDATLTAASNATIRQELAEPASVAKTAAGWTALETALHASDASKRGVQTTPMNVFGAAQEASPMVFIPGTTPVLQITIDYVVRTHDTKLNDQFTEVKQKITKTVEFTQPVELNKKYNIVMHLGLTNVKFTASVANWDDTNADMVDTDNDGEPDTPAPIAVDLPINVQ